MAKARRRVEHIGIRFTSEEKDRLQREADRLELSISVIVRRAVNGYFNGGQNGLVGPPIGRTLNISDVFAAHSSGPVDRKAVSGLGWDGDE